MDCLCGIKIVLISFLAFDFTSSNPSRRRKAGNSRKIVLSEEEKNYIVLQHNKMRRKSENNPSDLLDVIWDKELAILSDKFASECRFRYTSPEFEKNKNNFANFSKIGQNMILVATNKLDIYKAFDSQSLFFTSPERDYNYNTLNCGYYPCLSRVETVWSSHDAVGCGISACNTFEIREQKTYHWVSAIVCDYGQKVPGVKYTGRARAPTPRGRVIEEETKITEAQTTAYNSTELVTKIHKDLINSTKSLSNATIEVAENTTSTTSQTVAKTIPTPSKVVATFKQMSLPIPQPRAMEKLDEQDGSGKLLRTSLLLISSSIILSFVLSKLYCI